MPEYSKSTQQILNECERISGYACDIVIDGSIPTYATVKMAGRNGLNRHQIIVKESGSMLDYLVAWQAMFIQRQFQADEDKRANITSDPVGFEAIKTEMKQLYPQMDEADLIQFTDNIVSGIVTQLRSVPIGILIDIYLYREHENLRPAQQIALSKQVHEFWATLNIDTSQFPEQIVKANQYMNAAQAAMVDYQYPSPELMAPYKTAGMEGISLELLDVCLKHNSKEDIDDRSIIDDWASLLKIKNLYRWV